MKVIAVVVVGMVLIAGASYISSKETKNGTQNSSSHLLEFYGEGCPPCKKMEPLVERLEKEERVRIEKLEVWSNPKNAKRMEEYDRGRCGAVPFFYNTKNDRWICGVTTYEKLKEWALSQ